MFRRYAIKGLLVLSLFLPLIGGVVLSTETTIAQGALIRPYGNCAAPLPPCW